MISFSSLYIAIAITASIILNILPFLGSPPPRVQGTNLPTQHVFDEMHMDNQSYTVWNDDATQLWDALLPSNGGSVLATNLTSGYHFWGRIAMFHQLQCLKDIRKQFIAMTTDWEASKHLMSNRGYGSDYEEFGLCFDYLRQGLLCHADTTLNPVAFNSDWDDGKVVDGNVLWHQCKDRAILSHWADMSGLPSEVIHINLFMIWSLEECLANCLWNIVHAYQRATARFVTVSGIKNGEKSQIRTNTTSLMVGDA